jgi:hypothetical protein
VEWLIRTLVHMLLVSIGVRRNRTNTARLMRRRIPMISLLASRQRRLERRRMRLQAMVAVIPITRRLPHPCMEARIQDTRLHLLLLHPGLSQRIHTHLTSSPVEGITLRSLLIPLTQRRLQIHMDASRLPRRLHTLIQVPQQPLLATTLPRMVVNIPYRNSHNHRAIHSPAPLGTVRDRVHLRLTALLLFLRRYIAPGDTLSFQATGWCSGVWPT